MYIPSSFFGSQDACISASTSYTAGSGSITSGSFVSQSITWSYIQFENTHVSDNDDLRIAFSASLNILSGSTGRAKVLIVAGGGGGGGTSCMEFGDCGKFAGSGGGGGGVVYYDNFPLSSGSYEIVVGDGGTKGNTQIGYVLDQLRVNSFPLGGQNSYLKLPNNITSYTPFNTSYLIILL